MKSIYLLIAFIGATALFFYTFGNFTGQSNLLGNGNNGSADNQAASQEQPVGTSSIETKSFTPSDFGGPNGKPFIFGPQEQPPDY